MTRLICTLWLFLIAGAASSSEAPPQAQQDSQGPADVSPRVQSQLRWLDAVRAQRELREERRRTNKAVAEARRRQIDPWGAARQEARQEENRRRREALKDDVERNREELRKRSAWTYPMDPGYKGPPPPVPTARADGSGQGHAGPAHPPTGWDNSWYYRNH